MLTDHNRTMGFRAFYDAKCLVGPTADLSELSLATMVEDLGH